MKPLKFKVISEPWCEYQLEDGTVVRIRATMSGAAKDELNYLADGSPAHGVSHTMQVGFDVPEGLRKEPQLTLADMQSGVPVTMKRN